MRGNGDNGLIVRVARCVGTAGRVQGAREHGIGDQLLGGELGEARGGCVPRGGGHGDASWPLADSRSRGGRLGDCCVLGEISRSHDM